MFRLLACRLLPPTITPACECVKTSGSQTPVHNANAEMSVETKEKFFETRKLKLKELLQEERK